MPFEASSSTRFPRRTLIGLPIVGGLAFAFFPRERALPDAAQQGNGPVAPLALFLRDGKLQGVADVRTLIRSDADWRRELTSVEFGITRRKGTEFAFANLYWNCHQAGMYRCVCCGNALFRSQDKFDSETGWPSFSLPCAPGNIHTAIDSSHSLNHVEVLCRKCDAHLGHVFDDGPPPAGLRYCLNSAALRLVPYS